VLRLDAIYAASEPLELCSRGTRVTTFGSARDALLVLLNVPFSLAGGLVALYLRGMHLNVSAVVGFISLFGVAVMSGVLYVAEVRRRRADAGGDLREVTREAAAVQFRPESSRSGAASRNFCGTRASSSGYAPGARPSVVHGPPGSNDAA